MILAVDVGNTNVVLGLIEGEDLVLTQRLATRRAATETEYALMIHEALELSGHSARGLEGGIISSVVPPVTASIAGAFRLLTGTDPLVVGPGIKTGLPVLTDVPSAVGADRIVDAVAALAAFPPPLITVDMGTATTLSVVNPRGEFVGGVIMPGLRLSMDALTRSTSLLPQVSLDAPPRVIGRNTPDSMRSGLILGAASSLDGVLDMIESQLGSPCSVVATGGLAPLVIPHCRREIPCDPELLLTGLRIIYRMNQRP